VKISLQAVEYYPPPSPAKKTKNIQHAENLLPNLQFNLKVTSNKNSFKVTIKQKFFYKEVITVYIITFQNQDLTSGFVIYTFFPAQG